MRRKPTPAIIIIILFLMCTTIAYLVFQNTRLIEIMETDNMDFPKPLKQLTMINTNTGWAITGDNEILLTQDGGNIWDKVLQIDSINKYSDDFVNGFFLDETTAYIGFFSNNGSNIEMRYTTDKGITWRKTLISYSGHGGSNNVFINFTDTSNGYLLYCSDPGGGFMNKILFYTNDGGDTFEELADLSDIKGYPTGMAFSSDKQGFITSTYHGYEDKYLYMTKDAGITWESVRLPNHIEKTAYNYIDGYPPVFFGENRQEGILMLKCVSDNINFIFYHTKDGGTNWTPERLLNYDNIINYSFYNSKSGYLINRDGKVLLGELL